MTRAWNWYIEYAGPHNGYMYAIERVIYSGETPFQQVSVVDTFTYGRTLILDGKVQSAGFDEFIYHEALIHPAMILHANPRKVVVLGGGEGAVLRELCRYPHLEKIVMVDIDEKVVALCREHLPEWSQGCFDDPRVELLHLDARRYLEETDEKFDIIYSDLTEPVKDGPSRLLFTLEFYRLIRARLTFGGLLAVQGGDCTLDYPTIYFAVGNTLRQCFKNVYAYNAFIPSFCANWGYILAGDAVNPFGKSIAELDGALKNLASQLNFYDGRTHYGMFNPPKYLRAALEQEERIIRDDSPLSVY